MNLERILFDREFTSKMQLSRPAPGGMAAEGPKADSQFESDS